MAMDDLVARLAPQLGDLSLIHREIGTSDADQKKELEQISDAFLRLVSDHVDQASARRQALQLECGTIRDTMARWHRLMGEHDSPILVDTANTPLETCVARLKGEERAVKKQYDTRKVKVQALYEQLHYYVEPLGPFVSAALTLPDEEDTMDVSLAAVQALEEEIRRCKHEFEQRAQKVDRGAAQIAELRVALGVPCQNDRDQLLDQLYREPMPSNNEAIYISLVKDQQLHYMKQVIAQLQDIKQQRDFRKKEIEQSLQRLWERLQVSSEERTSFLAANQGLTTVDMDQYEKQLERMLELKSVHIEDFIIKAREELNKLWEQLYFSTEERHAFAPAFENGFNDSMLEAHENEIARLQLLVEDSKYILDKIEKHMKLLQEVRDFEASTKDPSRLFGGKGQRDPGRLLREEKFRKRISKELPKVCKELEGALTEYNASTGKPFCVYGESYLDKLNASQDSPSSVDKKKDKVDEEPATQPRPTMPAIPTTPRREPLRSPARPMTSPRRPLASRRLFRTPQTSHMRVATTQPAEPSDEWLKPHSLHRVQERAIRKRHVPTRLPRPRSSDSSQEATADENTMPRPSPLPLQKRALLPSDDEISIDDLGIFDGGPELSDMSDNDC